MPTPPWATSRQLEFLESQLPLFHSAQRQGTTADFFCDINREFFTNWPDHSCEIRLFTVPTKAESTERTKKDERYDLSHLMQAKWVELRKSVNQLFWMLIIVLFYCFFSNSNLGSTIETWVPQQKVHQPSKRRRSYRVLSPDLRYFRRFITRIRSSLWLQRPCNKSPIGRISILSNNAPLRPTPRQTRKRKHASSQCMMNGSMSGLR
jgi:hypothetical protein